MNKQLKNSLQTLLFISNKTCRYLDDEIKKINNVRFQNLQNDIKDIEQKVSKILLNEY